MTLRIMLALVWTDCASDIITFVWIPFAVFRRSVALPVALLGQEAPRHVETCSTTLELGELVELGELGEVVELVDHSLVVRGPSDDSFCSSMKIFLSQEKVLIFRGILADLSPLWPHFQIPKVHPIPRSPTSNCSLGIVYPNFYSLL